MKILFITQFLPHPPDTGGKIKTYQTLKLLSQKHQVFLISFVEEKRDLEQEKALWSFCYGLKTFVTPLVTSSHPKLKLRALLGLFHPKPFRVQKYFLKEAAHFIARLTRKEDFDAIHLDHGTSIQYLPYIDKWREKLKVYEEHNISSEGLYGYARYEKNPLMKIGYLVEGIKFRFYERRVVSLCDRVLAISKVDKEKLIKLGVKRAKIALLPIPFKEKSNFKFGPKNILFIGLLSWWPNKDAALWFYRQIFPFVKEKIPETKFLVVGANPPEEIKRIGETDSSVEVTGYVKDIQPFFKKTGVFVVPIRAGAGVRVKILDALASGLPVVSTKVAAAGIGVKNKKNIFLACEEEEFVEAVLRILKDEELAERLSTEGLKFVREKYNWRNSLGALEKTYTVN